MAKQPVNRDLFEQAQAGRLKRSNTAAGSEERKAVYASEYANRNQRANAYHLSYGQVRQLKALYPLSTESKSELRRNKRNVASEHTRYVVIRAEIARAERGAGKRVGKDKRKAARIISSAPPIPAPIGALRGWYQNAFGNHYDASAFGGIAGTATTKGGRLVSDDGGISFGGGGGEYGSNDVRSPDTDTIHGASLYGYDEYSEIETELFDIGWSDSDEWDLWDFGEY